MIACSNLINGALTPSSSGKTISVWNPTDGTLVGTVPDSTLEDVSTALQSAETAQRAWRRLPAETRGIYLREAAELLVQHREELSALLTAEHGKPLFQARAEVDSAAEFLRYAAESARRITGEIVTSELQREQIHIQRVPYGVTVGIVAWNFPLALVARKLGNSLVCGNSMILKPPSETPLTVMRFGEILAAESRLPAGVLQFISGSGRVIGDALVRNPITRLVSLTGSTAAGLEVFRAAADHCVEVHLELGGKAPFLVMDDADLDKAAHCAVLSKFNNCGQICTCNERMYVHEAVYDAFVEKLLAETRKIVVGDPTDPATYMGPMVSGKEVAKIRQIISHSVEQGARILLDMTPDTLPTPNGNWLYPTVLEVENNQTECMQAELFGPVLPIMKVKTFDEALHLANDCQYGLSAYLFTNHADQIMTCISELEFGEVYVNRENGELINGYHGGYKLSGTGGEDGVHGLEGYLQKKTMYVNYNL